MFGSLLAPGGRTRALAEGDDVNHRPDWPSQATEAVPEISSASLRYANGRVKRALDLVVGLVLSIVTAPVVAVLAVGSAVSLRAWPLFVQERLGRDGTEFHFVKLRSLPADTCRDEDKYTLADATTTTRWGRFIRSTHLDELPQFWLVVTGRMSLVGPRPEMPTLAATFDPTFVQERLAVRPGITGPWQVSPAVEHLIGEAPEYDRFYLAHASFKLDAWLALRTLGGLFGLRSVPLDQFPAWVGAAEVPAEGVDVATRTTRGVSASSQ